MKKQNIILIIITILFVTAIGTLFADAAGYKNFFRSGEDCSLKKVSELILVTSTALLAAIALWQLIKLNDTNFANLLSSIESRYGSPEILDARSLIQRIYIKAKPKPDNCKSKPKHSKACCNAHIGNIQKEIYRIGKSSKKSKEFILLLNFLDFLESVSYYTSVGYVSYKDIKEMFGGNLPYWFDVYEEWIRYRRIKFDEKRLYCEFEELVKKMRRKSWVHRLKLFFSKCPL